MSIVNVECMENDSEFCYLCFVDGPQLSSAKVAVSHANSSPLRVHVTNRT